MAVNWNRRGYTKEEFRSAWMESLFIAQVANKLNCNKTGGGYHSLHAAAADLGLDREHMTGQGHLKGKTHNWGKAIPLEEVLVGNRLTSSTKLKERLWKIGALPKHCQECEIDSWRGKPAPLELDHINGKHNDNRIENLRILCRNCHGQTETFCRRNGGVAEPEYATGLNPVSKEKNLDAGSNPVSPTLCRCGKKIQKRSKTCRGCNNKTKIDWPPREELLKMLSESNYTVVGRTLGVSDNAVRKRLKTK